MAGTLIAITHRSEDLAFLGEVAASCGLTLRNPGDLPAAMNLINNEGNPLIFVDASTKQLYDDFEAAVQSTFGLFSAKLNANRLHYLSSEDIFDLPYLINSPLFGSYIRRNFTQTSSVGAHYGRIVSATMRDRAFGTANLVKPGTKVQTIQLQRSDQKQEAVEVVRNFLVAIKFQTRMATIIANAVDELLMNAIFDAPADNTGKQTYGQTARNTLFALDGRAVVELQVAYDGEYVVLTAVDQFGSLDKGRLLASISRIYRDQEYRVKISAAGAGLGLASVFHSGGSFLFSSEQGARTEVSVFFRRCDNFREFKNQFRFISTQFYF